MKRETLSQASVHRFLDKPLGCKMYDKAFVLPSKDLWKDGKCFGGVVTKEGEFVESSAWHEGKRCDKYDFDPSKAKEDAGIVIYMGFYNSCWGHAITDNLKKLWYLKTEECKSLLKQGAKLIYLTIDNKPQPSYVKRLFELADADIDSFELVTEITRFDKIFVPDNSFIADNGQRYFTQPYVDSINLIKKNVSSTIKGNNIYPEKIYFTRTHIRSQRDWGEMSIERVFKNKGYHIIAPEEKTVEEQIAFLMNCTYFATTEGSISHNVVFCQPKTEVTIVRKCYDVNKYQMAVNEVSDVNVTYIDAHNSTKAPNEAPWVGPFFLYNNEQLLKWNGSFFINFPLWMRPIWWLYKNQDKNIVRRAMRLHAKLIHYEV